MEKGPCFRSTDGTCPKGYDGRAQKGLDSHVICVPWQIIMDFRMRSGVICSEDKECLNIDYSKLTERSGYKPACVDNRCECNCPECK